VGPWSYWSCLVFSFSDYARVENDLQIFRYEHLSQGVSFQYLFWYFAFSGVLMIAFLFLGLSISYTLDSNISTLDSLAQYPHKWKLEYGEQATLESMKLLSTGLFYIIAGACLLLTFVLAFVYSQGIMIARTQDQDRSTTLFLSFNSIVLPAVALGFLYLTLASGAEVEDIPGVGAQFMPPYAVNSFIATTVVVLALTFLGMAALSSESKPALDAYNVVIGLLFFANLASAIIVISFSNRFVGYYDTNWASVMK